LTVAGCADLCAGDAAPNATALARTAVGAARRLNCANPVK